MGGAGNRSNGASPRIPPRARAVEDLISRLDPAPPPIPPLCMIQVRPGHALPMRESSGTHVNHRRPARKRAPPPPPSWTCLLGPSKPIRGVASLPTPPPREVCYHQQTLPDSCPQGRGLKGERGQGGTAVPFPSQHPPQPAIPSGCIDATEFVCLSVEPVLATLLTVLHFVLSRGRGGGGVRLGGQSRGRTSGLHLVRRNQPTKHHHHWNLPSL